ncbi:MAG: ankyrin repeat domain-containing protein [Deltaproteobacteria bacterium]|nr:ankyrin repeat domain-containing protein [Deltaproteobacteria bacterium]
MRRALIAAMVASCASTGTEGAHVSPLHEAVRVGDAEAVRRILEDGAAIDERDVQGRTALWLAACEPKVPNPDIVGALTAARADANVRWDLDSTGPLHCAAESGSSTVAVALLAAGAKVGLRDPMGRTPAEVAEDSGHRILAELLAARTPSFALRSCRARLPSASREAARSCDELQTFLVRSSTTASPCSSVFRCVKESVDWPRCRLRPHVDEDVASAKLRCANKCRSTQLCNPGTPERASFAGAIAFALVTAALCGVDHATRCTEVCERVPHAFDELDPIGNAYERCLRVVGEELDGRR